MIIEYKSRDFNGKEMYNITRGKGNVNARDRVGQTLHVKGIVKFVRDGSESPTLGMVVSSENADHEIILTNSKILISDVVDISGMVDDPNDFYIRIVEGRSRAGRTFLSGEWV